MFFAFPSPGSPHHIPPSVPRASAGAGGAAAAAAVRGVVWCGVVWCGVVWCWCWCCHPLAGSPRQRQPRALMGRTAAGQRPRGTSCATSERQADRRGETRHAAATRRALESGASLRPQCRAFCEHPSTTQAAFRACCFASFDELGRTPFVYGTNRKTTILILWILCGRTIRKRYPLHRVSAVTLLILLQVAQ